MREFPCRPGNPDDDHCHTVVSMAVGVWFSPSVAQQCIMMRQHNDWYTPTTDGVDYYVWYSDPLSPLLQYQL